MRPSTDASGTPPRFPSLCREFKVFDHPTSIHSGYGIFGTGRSPNCHTPAMLIIGIILFGLLVGAVAQLIVGKSKSGIDWGLACAAGVGGSFVGGLVISLIAGDGLALRPSGIIGSLAGAIIVTAAWSWWKSRPAAETS